MSDARRTAKTVVLPPPKPAARVGSQRVYFTRGPGGRIDSRKIGNPRSKAMKLTGAAKAAFLARMARGRAGRVRLRTAPARIAAMQAKERQALIERDGPYFYESPLFGRVSTPRKRGNPMARLARNRKGQFLPRTRNAAVANPRKKGAKARKRAASVRRLHAAAASANRKSARKRRGSGRRYPHTVTFRTPNPRRRRRARNPSFGGILASIKSAALPMALGGVAGLSAGYMDAKYLGSKPTLSILAKIGLAVIGAGLIGQKHALAAAGWAGGMIGSTGYHAGVTFGGGMVGLSPSGALKGIADMAADDPEMASLIAGLGDVVDENGNALADAADDYNEALADSDDEMADLVEEAA